MHSYNISGNVSALASALGSLTVEFNPPDPYVGPLQTALIFDLNVPTLRQSMRFTVPLRLSPNATRVHAVLGPGRRTIAVQLEYPIASRGRGGPVPCADIFDGASLVALGGANASCALDTALDLRCDVTANARQTITVRLPPALNIAPGSTLALRESLEEVLLASDLSPWYRTACNRRSAEVKAPEAVVIPTPVITGPAVVSLCADVVTFDASRTVGTSGRPLNFRWTLRRAYDPIFVDMLFGEVSCTEAILTLPTSMLEDDTAYVLGVTVGGADIAQGAASWPFVTRTEAAIPQIVAISQAPIKPARRQPLHLTATIHQPCPAQRAEVWIVWEFVRAYPTGGDDSINHDPDFVTTVFPNARNTTPAVTGQPYLALSTRADLAVPAYAMRPGLTYSFAVHTGYPASPDRHDVRKTEVAIPRAPLVARALLPTAIGANDTATLDGSACEDPDGTATLEYVWALSGASCFGLGRGGCVHLVRGRKGYTGAGAREGEREVSQGNWAQHVLACRPQCHIYARRAQRPRCRSIAVSFSRSRCVHFTRMSVFDHPSPRRRASWVPWVRSGHPDPRERPSPRWPVRCHADRA